MEMKKGTLSVEDIQAELAKGRAEMWANYNKNHAKYLASQAEAQAEVEKMAKEAVSKAEKEKEEKTEEKKAAPAKKAEKGKKKKVYHRANRMKKAEAREALYSTGLYVHYQALEKAELESKIAEPDQVWGISGAIYDGIGLARDLIAYKDSHCKKYNKTREVGKKGKKRSKTYRNIYATELRIMLPREFFKGWKTIDPATFCPLFLKQLDPRATRLLWCAKVYKSEKVMYIRIIVFSYSILKNTLKIKVKYPSDYYWNPETKKRCKKDDPKAVLLHKKGEVKKDKDGNEMYEEHFCSPKALGIFTYTKKVDYSSLSGFEIMVEHIKQALANTLSILECGEPCSSFRARIRKMKWKKTYAQSTLLKVKLVNKLVDMVNAKLGRIFRSFEAGGFFDDKELAKKFRWLRHRLTEIVHGDSFKYHGIKVIMNFKGYYESFKEKTTLMEYKVNEVFAEFDEFVQSELAF